MDKTAIFLAMIEKDEANYEAWYLLAEEYILNDQLSDALFAFSKALKKQDDKMKNLVLESLKKVVSTEVIQLDGRSNAFAQGPEKMVETADSYGKDPENMVKTEDIKTEAEEVRKTSLKVIDGKKKSNVVNLEDRLPERITFADVGGLDNLKQTIEMKIIKPFVEPGLFSKFRKKTGGGILLYGPPGCGKTFIAQATAGECNANFYSAHISEILDPYIGVSERNLHNIFTTARANRPSVLFFDEIDTLGYSRSKSRSEVMRPLVDSMLTELQSINTNTEKLLVIGATNMPWDVDPAFKRPGRFDKLVFVPPPDKAARKIIMELKLYGKPIATGFDLELLADRTEYYSGADLENVIEVATENVLYEIMKTNKERLITMEDILTAIDSTKPSTLEWMTTIKNYIKYANQGGLYDEASRYIKEFL
ncbi:ATP-binding protein [Bacillus sp. 1NLA3E]|uniref:ATP-binding protein n=1 Tax=Bacillus sp. 1NLA3E TaxID=666686 RepID=UPI000247E638|nr:ATP-binding protein [Bacillus sp. 1NLA3E]AGK53726.1 AAA ATPase [Bacillus sp. 1NLA3E]